MSETGLPRAPVLYSSPPHKRKLGRVIAIGSTLLLVFLVYSSIRNWQVRAEKGIPASYSSAVMWVGPLMLIGIGLWIGWGHTRVDFTRGLIVRRPLGLPFPSKRRPLSEAKCLYVGFHRGPSALVTPNAAMLMKSHVYWYVQLQGPDFLIPLVVQRASKEEAMAFAERIGEATGLPVEATNQEP